MALWKDLGKKASDTRAKAVEQAKVLTESTRLYGVIAEEKKKLEEHYLALGKLYMEKHRDDYEDAFAQLAGEILASEQVIQDSQEQIRNMKGVQCCEKCGAELSKNSAFCSSCGAPVPKPKAPEGIVCSKCGTVLAEGMKFCTSCGTPTARPAAPQPAAAQPAVISEPAPEVPAAEVEAEVIPAGPRVCPKCGAQMDPDAVFCTECGYKLP